MAMTLTVASCASFVVVSRGLVSMEGGGIFQSGALNYELLAMVDAALILFSLLVWRRLRGAEADLSRTRREMMDRNEILEWLVCQIVVTGAGGRQVYANRRHLEYFGLRLEDIADSSWLEAIHPEERDAAAQEWRRCVAAGVTLDGEYRMRRCDGAYRWFHARFESMGDDDGIIVRWHGSFTDIDRWKSAEHSLRDSEQNLRTTIDAVPALIWRTNSVGEVDYVNRRCVEFHGQTVEEFADAGWRHLVHPDDMDLTLQRWRYAVQTHLPFDYTYRFRRMDGAYRWMRVCATPLFAEDGRIVSWFGTHTDVHEQKEAENALLETERRLSMLMETIPAMVWRANAEGELDYINQRCTDYLGLTLADCQNFGWLRLVHPDDVEHTMERWHRSSASGQPFETTYRFRYTDGVYRWIKVSAAPLRDQRSGNVLYWYGVHLDIDEQKRSEEAQLQRERQLRGIIDTIPCLAWRATPEGNLAYMNHRVSEYTGMTLDELNVKGWIAVVHPDDLDAVAKAWQHSASTGNPYHIVNRYRRFDGVYCWFDVRANAVFDEQGGIVCWYGIDLNVDDRVNLETELRTTKARLAHASQVATMGELSASIAHEINQPLSAVVSNGDACLRWLSTMPPNLERARVTVEKIVRDGTSAAAIVQRIRSLFKRDAPQRVPLDINEIVEEVLALMRDELVRNMTGVSTVLAERLPRVLADRVQLQQILINLVQNGIDAMETLTDRRKKLLLKTQYRETEGVLIEVCDVGIGIADPNKIFDPFFTTKAKGLGVGLSICRSIIETHGGRLWAQANEGYGATLAFTLPTARALAGSAADKC